MENFNFLPIVAGTFLEGVLQILLKGFFIEPRLPADPKITYIPIGQMSDWEKAIYTFLRIPDAPPGTEELLLAEKLRLPPKIYSQSAFTRLAARNLMFSSIQGRLPETYPVICLLPRFIIATYSNPACPCPTCRQLVGTGGSNIEEIRF